MTTAEVATADALRAACPGLRPADDGDDVDGVRPEWVAEAASTDEVSAVLAAAARHDLTVVVRGAGTRLGWGNPPHRCDLLVDVSRMDAVVEHAAGDLIATVQAGTRLADLQETLAPRNQRLALDQPVPGATVGGTIATATAGPLRYYYGSVRDLLIGITVVRADGTVARSGGKVVKNVAGYDLGKLYTGSLGTLGVITEATFRLHPLPESTRWITAAAPDARRAGAAIAAVRGSQVMASGLEVDRREGAAEVTVAVAVEGIAGGIEDRAGTVARLLQAETGAEAVLADEAPQWWSRLPFDGTGAADERVGLTVTHDPAALPAILDAAAASAIAVRGSAGTGVLGAAMAAGTSPTAAAEALDRLRGVVGQHGGSVVVRSAPAAVKAALDVWGPTPAGVLELMRRIKDEFDPEHRLAPGRFVGGI